jgi:uncharacterized surface protein with fasciclin (FAS1) repeats
VTLQGQNVTVTINEDGVFINDAKVTVVDLEADNGVVHVIDAVLGPGPATVVDIIVGSEDHTTLAAAVTAADLVDALSGEGPFTVFAPTDAAFDALPEGTVEALLDDIPALTNILLYHVAAGKAFSTDLSDGQKIVTLQGQNVTVTINEDGVFINDAKVTVVDLEADNGVVHVIDAVLGPGPATVVDIIVGSEDHTTLAAAVTAADLVDALSGEGPFTVFAPTDAAFDALPEGLLDDLLADAFDALPEGTVEALLDDIPALTEILLYHVAAGKAFSTDLSDGQKIVTLQGQNVTVTINEDGVFINDAKVTVVDLEADNGVVHVIDAVLGPGPATVVDIIVGSEDHTTLAAVVTAAELVDALSGEGPFTVFAPTDAAFDALPEGTLEALLDDIPALTDILLYHVAAGKAFSTDLSDGQKIVTLQGQRLTVTINEDGVFINDAKVTVVDLEADNGVVHVIDAVLLPADLPATVVDIIVGSEDHTTLAAAVTAADLIEALQGEGPFTVFAPTDAAFDALPEGTVEALLDDIPTLTEILLYHVAAGKAFSTDLADGQEIETLQGEKLIVTINEDGVFINDAKVTVVDLEADNGVVHVIDAVLIPDVVSAPLLPESRTITEPRVYAYQGTLFVRGSEPVSLDIYNIVGSKVKSAQNVHEVSLHDLENGIYIVRVYGEPKAVKIMKY